jgi:hypothetical protein
VVDDEGLIAAKQERWKRVKVGKERMKEKREG